MRHVSATLLAASVLLGAAPALAREPEYRIDIGPVELSEALTALSARTGVSIIYEVRLPRRRINGLRGKMGVAEALQRMLRGLELEAQRIGPRAFRLTRRAPQPGAKPLPPVPAPVPIEDIVVTGRKQSERLSQVAASLAVYEPDLAQRTGVGVGARELAQTIDGLAVGGGRSGRARLFIRGIADSPLNGFTQTTTSVQVDEARVTFDAPEPGLRLVDVARVEVLKGPQGPLYGVGALGGVYRIVTNRPDLEKDAFSVGLGSAVSAGGGTQWRAEGVANLVVMRGAIGLRLVGYAANDPGWIDNPSFGRNLNAARTTGARIAVRIAPVDDWRLDLSAWSQTVMIEDGQYVGAPGSSVRDVPVLEPSSDHFRAYQGTIAGMIGPNKLTIATGLSEQSQVDNFHAAAPDTSPLAIYYGSRQHSVFNQEVRLESPPDTAVSWLAGASFLLARSQIVGWTLAQYPVSKGYPQTQRRVIETALFADMSVRVAPRLRLGLGLRGFGAAVRDERFASDDVTSRAEMRFGAAPNLSLAYEIAPEQLIFARFATALRPGGLDPDNVITRRYEADEVRGVELGARLRLDDRRLRVGVSLFATDWRHVQSDYLDQLGIVATRNVGDATNVGAEIALDWRPSATWRVEAGTLLQQPRLRPQLELLSARGRLRLPVVSDLEARLALSRQFSLGSWRIAPRISGKLVGASRFSLEQDIDRSVPPYFIARVATSASLGRMTLGLEMENLSDTRADTAGLGNPFTIRSASQYTPLPPRTVSLWLTRRF